VIRGALVSDAFLGVDVIEPPASVLKSCRNATTTQWRFWCIARWWSGIGRAWAKVPVSTTELVQTVYAWGVRNIELHVAQCLGPIAKARGISFPTFLPESG